MGKLGTLAIGKPDSGVPLLLSPYEPQRRPMVYRTGPPCAHQGPHGPCGGRRYGRLEASDEPEICRRCGRAVTP